MNIFENCSDLLKDYKYRGDIIVQIVPIKYKNIIYYDYNDLIINKDISIREMIFGTEFNIEYLDKKTYKIKIDRQIEIGKLYKIENI